MSYRPSLAQVNESQSRPSPRTGFIERQAKNVPEPATFEPSDELLWKYGESGVRRPDPDFLKQHFFREGRLTEAQAMFILEEATELLTREPNMLDVSGPSPYVVTSMANMYDLMKLLDIGGGIEDNNYLFLGDYVDRGCFGIECLLYLYALKLTHPHKLYLLRGNHECRHLTEYFTFKRECLHKYSERVYEACIKSFCALPVAALVESRFFCVHGGISPQLNTFQDLIRMNRFEEPGSHGLLCDLLWADPVEGFGHEEERAQAGALFLHNETRGCSYYYTYDAVCRFLDRNGVLGVIRGHEAQDAGYTMHRKHKKFPSVITIFSAPNYLDVYHNRGAVIKYANKNITIRQYNWSSHPFWLPNFMDAFTWSLPFVGVKIVEMLLAVLSVCTAEELEEEDGSGSGSEEDDTRTIADLALTPTEIAQRRQQIKNKILAVGRMQRVFQLLREEAENASELTAAEAGEAGTGAGLGVTGTSIRRYIRTFDDARKSDIANERLPELPGPGDGAFPLVPVPSMRPSMTRRNTEMPVEALIKRALDGNGGAEGLGRMDEYEQTKQESEVEVLAERIASGRSPSTRRRTALKRHDTAP